MQKMIQLDFQSRKKNPIVARTPTPPKNLRLRNPDGNGKIVTSSWKQEVKDSIQANKLAEKLDFRTYPNFLWIRDTLSHEHPRIKW